MRLLLAPPQVPSILRLPARTAALYRRSQPPPAAPGGATRTTAVAKARAGERSAKQPRPERALPRRLWPVSMITSNQMDRRRLISYPQKRLRLTGTTKYLIVLAVCEKRDMIQHLGFHLECGSYCVQLWCERNLINVLVCRSTRTRRPCKHPRSRSSAIHRCIRRQKLTGGASIQLARASAATNSSSGGCLAHC